MSTVVTDTRVARSADRILALPEKARQRPRAAFAAVLALAAVVYLVGIGRSSLFIDEVFSWNASRHGMAGIGDAVRGAEVTPPLYYVLLHAWLGVTGASSEAMLRLPSVLAGVGFVAATGWFGTAISDRRTGLTAAGLAALSPLALQYAQEVRAYIFVMLAVTVSAAAAVRLVQEPDRRRWLAITVVAGATSVLLHYTAALVLAPLAVWLLAQREVPLVKRLAVAAAFALPLLALLPLLATQLGGGHHDKTVDAYARITHTNLLRLFATPFDGRSLDGAMTLRYELGFVALVDALALLSLSDRMRHVRGRWMLVGASVLPIVAIVAVSALVNPFAITRYTTVTIPFVLVAIAVVAWRAPRVMGMGLLAIATVASVLGVAGSQTQAGQWPDLRTAMGATADRAAKGDVVVGLNNVRFEGSQDYYDERFGMRTRGYASAPDALASPRARRALRSGHRVFMVSWPPVPLKAAVADADATVRSDRRYPGVYDVQVAEVVRR